MPKILINEKDYTSPGSAGRYANHAILITGLEATSIRLAEKSDDGKSNPTKGDPITGRLPMYRLEEGKDPETWASTGEYEVVYNRPVQPDDNGVYEFSSAEDFEKTIGLVPPKFINTDAGTEVINYHYGNQMAYELLKLGYPIFYKSLNPTTHEYPEIDSNFTGKGEPDVLAENADNVETVDPCEGIKKMAYESFWAPFKDKATYDFRFITHGLLESSPNANDVKITEAETNIDNIDIKLVAIDKLETILKEVNEDKSAKFDREAYTYTYTDDTTEISDYRRALDGAFASLIDNTKEDDPILNYLKYKPVNTRAKNTSIEEIKYFVTAWDVLIGETDTATSTISDLEDTKADHQVTLNTLTAKIITITDINKANAQIANLAKYEAGGLSGSTSGLDIPSRGDCVALIELDEVCYRSTKDAKPEVLIVEAINNLAAVAPVANQYCALTVPSVVYKMTANKSFGNNKKFPGAFHYLACYA